ncbi:Survival motor neuron (SMN) interacting protein 1 (SIP1) [Acrodontium crateriforme]|uniref:Survival motor neuron (SMN) interacting protein 1 (SIP1) n=1 Tax=Acrodontium crateriforme TaxID=150365 RepID=A0AAQ3RCK6_9PEZI|nr:Survival motor neuron (SMN) interacting protein 1 (SIP1) [Acrodontium crateriforme]
MPKRRRERDRPKAAPDGVYNPNKRVLLTYESDDESGTASEIHAAGPECLEPLLHAPKPLHDTRPYNDDASNDLTVRATEIPARVQTEDDGGNEQENSERLHEGHSKRQSAVVRRNPTTNQLPALGSLSYQWDEDDGDEYAADGRDDAEEDEAMAYLRAVRAERQTLPPVMRASPTDEDNDIYESGIGDSRGYLDEDAFIGRFLDNTDHTSKTNQFKDPQEAYNENLKERFLLHRTQLHLAANENVTFPFDEQHPTRVGGTKRAHSQWIHRLKHTIPLPAQVRALDQHTVFRLLEFVQETHLVKCSEISNIASVWIWSLLARLDDVGEMANGQVSLVREFGKQAVLVLVSLRDPAIARQLEAVNSANDHTSEKEEEDNTSSELLTEEGTGQDEKSAEVADNHLTPRENTLVTLDMILTIVGDVFGQRDLLEFRRKWATDETP